MGSGIAGREFGAEETKRNIYIIFLKSLARAQETGSIQGQFKGGVFKESDRSFALIVYTEKTKSLCVISSCGHR